MYDFRETVTFGLQFSLPVKWGKYLTLFACEDKFWEYLAQSKYSVISLCGKLLQFLKNGQKI